MVLSKGKKRASVSNEEKTSEFVESDSGMDESEKDSSDEDEQGLNYEDKSLLVANKIMPPFLKDFKLVTRMPPRIMVLTIQVTIYLKRKNKYHTKKATSDLGTDTTSDEDSTKKSDPIEKPDKAKYINIPKILKIKKPIYNSYQKSLHLMIVAKYEKKKPEFQKIPESKKDEIIQKFKCKNPKFSLIACDWAIR
ncbi:3909_t:CDS:2 [Ambispora gerdemannii]|uniref:3909_t:CDS:1 n=1 Tax=Ambispora gerdemannii TaxID=144530 RepID=A0A9N9DAP0_9GLOM|nr:3909_t:CDS:2 [Ambispora gerdemannii]